MKNQSGFIQGSILAIVILAVLLINSLGFGVWAFMGRADYKNNVEAKVSEAVDVAKKAQLNEDTLAFAELEKSPYRSYIGAADFSQPVIVYPKTWSVYENHSSGEPIDVYFKSLIVTNIDDETSRYNLRLEVVNSSLADMTQQYSEKQRKGEVTIKPYLPELVPGAETGLRVDGQIDSKLRGSVVLIKARDKVIKLSVESEEFIADFDSVVLKNLKFNP